MKTASEGIEWMKKETDSLIVIPNDRILEMVDYIVGIVGDNVNLILGMTYEEGAEDQCELTLIATGPAN